VNPGPHVVGSFDIWVVGATRMSKDRSTHRLLALPEFVVVFRLLSLTPADGRPKAEGAEAAAVADDHWAWLTLLMLKSGTRRAGVAVRGK